jgi:hypothetical protein
MNPIKTTPKDVFLHLGVIVALYVSAISFINLLFTVINVAFPEVGSLRGYYHYSSSISWPVAALIVFFPLYIFLSWFLGKEYAREPERREVWIRRWFIYITLFIAGLTIAVDLVTVLYRFLDGQELTTAFLLKVLTILIVAGGIFTYYISDIRGTLNARSNKIAAVVTACVVIIAIIIGFSVIGSPQTQRLIRIDQEKVSHLQDIQWRILDYWTSRETVPDSLEDLRDQFSGYSVPTDPQTGELYEYRKISDTSFELCATFNRPSRNQNEYFAPPSPMGGYMNENFAHEEGRTCFERTIDPSRYPPRTKGF